METINFNLDVNTIISSLAVIVLTLVAFIFRISMRELRNTIERLREDLKDNIAGLRQDITKLFYAQTNQEISQKLDKLAGEHESEMRHARRAEKDRPK